MKKALSYLKFGVVVSLSGSFSYIYNKSDRFFAGKFWSANTLGLYTFALELASIPTNKIVSLINQVSYAGFAKLQNDNENFNRFYLNVIKIISIIVVPLYVGLFFVGENAIRIFLNEKWFGMIFVFKGLCLVQIVSSLLAVNNYALTAKGNPYQSLVFNAVMTILLVPSFYFATKNGFKTILIPWFTVYIIMGIGLVFHTLKKLQISIFKYIFALKEATIAALIMSCVLHFERMIKFSFIVNFFHLDIVILVTLVLSGSVTYILSIWILDRTIIKRILSMLKP
jgi:O-antigen/teichoic acid export membrane protein